MLNIKNPEAHKLAQQLARETGASMTCAVIQALRDRLQRVRKRSMKEKMSVEDMLALGRRIRKRIKGPVVDHAKLLYDKRGLPK